MTAIKHYPIIEPETWEAMWNAYGHVSVDLYNGVDKMVLLREALQSDAVDVPAALHDFFGDNLMAPLFWTNHRAGVLELRKRVWDAFESDLMHDGKLWEDSQNDA